MKHTVADEYIFQNNHKTGIIRRHKCSGVNRIVMMFSFVTEENGTYRPQSLSAGITSPRQRLLLMPDEPDRRGKVTPSRNQEQARPATTWADRESDSESARSHSRISTSSDATSPRVSTSRPDAITRLSTSEPASGTCPVIAPMQQNKSTIVRPRSFVCAADDARPKKRVKMRCPEAHAETSKISPPTEDGIKFML